MADPHDLPDPSRLKPVSAEVPRELSKAISSSKTGPGASGPGFEVIRELGKELEPRLTGPRGVAARRDGWVFVLDRPSPSEYRITGFPPDNARPRPLRIPKGPGDEELVDPVGLSLDRQGQLYLPDAAGGAIKKFSADGRWLASFTLAASDGSRFDGPRDVAIDDAGNLVVADTNNNRLVGLTADGEPAWLLERFAAAGGDDEFYEPWSVCVSGGLVWVADTNNNRVLGFDAQHKLRGTLSRGEPFVFPSGIRAAPDGKAVHVADHGNLRIRRYEIQGGGLAVLTLVPRIDRSASVAGGAAVDIDAAGHVVAVHPLRGSVVILAYPGGS